MGVMNIYNMDIVDFITAKSEDENKLNHFNLSVMIDDDFMKAVESDEEIFLHHPVYDSVGKILKDKEKWEYSKKVRAIELWNLIIQKAYDNGEPGVFFYDNLNNDNNLHYVENIVSSNPCFTGSMRLLTSEGYKSFKELENRNDIEVVSIDGTMSIRNKIWCSGEKEVISVKLNNGRMIECTPDHIFMLKSGEECKAENLKGKSLKTFSGSDITVDEIEQIGIQLVYDFTENKNHWGVVEGVIVHNCAEYLAGTVYGKNSKTSEVFNPDDFGGACNLGNLILYKFVEKPFTLEAKINYKTLKQDIFTAIKMLDDVIDINNYPDKIYENYQKSFRSIGLGITGLADALCMLNLKYNTIEAQEFVYDLMNFIAINSYKASIELAKEKGEFSLLNREEFVKSGFLQKHVNKHPEWQEIIDDILKYGIRNSKILSCPPAGTTSLTFGYNCSSGIEPIFNLSYDRKVKINGQQEDNIEVVTLEDYAYKKWKEFNSDENIVKEEVFVTAMDMSVDSHIEMLKNIAFHIDMSVSKTINVPTEYSFEDTKDIYMKCWKYGIKGCTIFRPNEIRQGIFVNKDSKTKEIPTKTHDLKRGEVIQVSDNVIGKKRKLTTGCGSLHCTAFFDPKTGNLLETYLSKGSTGGCNNFMIGLSRMISLASRAGCNIYSIIDQLNSCGSCPSYTVRFATKRDTSKGSCCPTAIGNALLDMYNEMQEDLKCEVCLIKEKLEIVEDAKSDIRCPECNAELRFEGGCNLCIECGYSKCS